MTFAVKFGGAPILPPRPGVVAALLSRWMPRVGVSVPSGIVGVGLGNSSGLVGIGVGGPMCLVGVGVGGGVGVVNDSSGLVMGVPYNRSLALLMRASRDPSFGVRSLLVARAAVGSIGDSLDMVSVNVGLGSGPRGVSMLCESLVMGPSEVARSRLFRGLEVVFVRSSGSWIRRASGDGRWSTLQVA